jgi:hypothetical protein
MKPRGARAPERAGCTVQARPGAAIRVYRRDDRTPTFAIDNRLSRQTPGAGWFLWLGQLLMRNGRGGEIEALRLEPTISQILIH